MASSNSGSRAPLRFGVCGTGHWADLVHLPALATIPDVQLVGVFGRSAKRVGALAAKFSCRAFDDFDKMVDTVDAVSFAVPPSVQAELGRRAANAGKHVLLEKPIATSLAEADRLVAAIETAGVSSAVFLTRLFADSVQATIASARAAAPTHAESRFSSGALLPGSPYAASSWRLARFGTLWDVGPHVLSVLVSVLGPVAKVSARHLRPAAFEATFEHVGGQRSTTFLDLMDAKADGVSERYAFTGGARQIEAGPFRYDRRTCFAGAVESLLARAAGRMSDAPDARFARDLVAVLAAAEASVSNDGVVQPVRAGSE